MDVYMCMFPLVPTVYTFTDFSKRGSPTDGYQHADEGHHNIC